MADSPHSKGAFGAALIQVQATGGRKIPSVAYT